MQAFFYNWAIQEGLTPNDVRMKPVESSPHLRSISSSSSSYGWVYYNQYTDDTCDSPVTMQSASVAYQCFQTEMVNGTKYSQMITCGENAATNTRYTSLNCQAGTQSGQLVTPLNKCFMDTNDDGYPGYVAWESGCTTSSQYPLPAGEWVLDANYVNANCQGIADYTAVLNNTCIDSTSTDNGQTYNASFIYEWPMYISYSTVDCTGPPDTPHNFTGLCLSYNVNDDVGNSVFDTYYPDEHAEGFFLVSSSGFIAPTYSPAQAPSRNPSLKPFAYVTISPSFIAAADLSFTSNITITGVTANYFDWTSQYAIINTSATVMNLPFDEVYFEKSYVVSSNAVATETTAGGKGGVTTKTTTYTLIAETVVAIPITSQTDYQGLYTQLSTALTNSVKDGTYSTLLQSVSVAVDSTQTMNAAATNVSNSLPYVNYFQFDDWSFDDDFGASLGAGAIAGIVIAILFVLGLIGGVIWYFVVLAKKNSNTTNTSTMPTAKAELDPNSIAMTENPISGRATNSIDNNTL